MMFKGIQTSVIPYDDGSGYKAGLTLDGAMQIHIKQGDNVVVLSACEWGLVKGAIDRMYKAAGSMLAPTPNGE